MKTLELLNEYLRVKALSPFTEKTYHSVITCFLNDTGAVTITDVTEDLLLDWRNTILKRTTPATWNNYHRHIRAIIRYAVTREYLDNNPLTYITAVPTPSCKKKTVHTTSLKIIIRDLERNPELVQHNGWFWAVILKTFYYTGMRRRQLVGLRWNDLDFKTSKIKLRSATSKTYREWEIPLDSRIYNDLLFLHRETKKLANQEFGTTAISKRQVFCLPLFANNPPIIGRNKELESEELTKDYVTKKLMRLGKHFGVKLSPHRLRHTFGTEIANSLTAGSEVPFGIKALQEQLGHSTVTTTLGYVTPNISQQRQLVQILDTL